MRFSLDTSGCFYSDEQKDALEPLGFRFERDMQIGFGEVWRKTDESPIAVEIATLDDLLAFIRKYGKVVIAKDGDGFEVEIYDDYRE